MDEVSTGGIMAYLLRCRLLENIRMANFLTSVMNDMRSAQTTATGATETNNKAPSDLPTEDISELSVDSEGSVQSSDSIDDEDDTSSPDSDETPTPASPVSDPAHSKKAAADTQTSGNKETIVVTDETGKRRRVEVDYTDRAAIKKAIEMQHGARKWQADRDKAIAAEKSTREKYESDRRVLDALETAFSERGELGVIDLIAGKAGASQEFIKRQVDRARYLESASPEEIEKLTLKEQNEQFAKELAKIRAEGQTREERVAKERETAELASLESRVNPSFEKYRFDGKLGDADDEAMFDEMLWGQALKRLEPYEDKGLEITSAMVEQAFKETATRLRKRIGATVDKKTAQVIEGRKQAATENVQHSVSSGYKKGGARKEAEDLIGKGDFRSLFGNWGKYSGSKK
jgi:hypothetical protein